MSTQVPAPLRMMVTVPKELLAAVQERAALEDRSASSVTRAALKSYLEVVKKSQESAHEQ
jgi:metal-responsive CopG/Arc/MetJ family transcriptional regulator